MASAAAVATNVSTSPLPYQEVDDTFGTTGTITGADDVLPDEVPDEDDDDDIARPVRRKQAATTDVVSDEDGILPIEGENGQTNGAADNDDDDDEELFGSEPDDDKAHPKPRLLDDGDLDSGDDEGRADRLREEENILNQDEEIAKEELTFMDVEFGRHPVPEPSDGEMYLMKIPQFLAVASHAFDPEQFQPPTTEHHSRVPASSAFSAYNTATTTLRWRRAPSNADQLQSNARIIRWSDGSLTMQLANAPKTQYTIQGRALAPPQVNPRKPTPSSLKRDKRRGRNEDIGYKVEQDAFTYLAAPNEAAALVRITNKITTSLLVNPAVDSMDEAMARLQDNLASAASFGMGSTDAGGIGVVHLTEDPELAKKKAELAEREKERARKRREAQEQRDRDRGARPGFSRRGMGYGAGLTVGGLEDDDDLNRAGTGRHPSSGKPRKKPRPNRRGEILTDEEEDYGRRIHTKEDEYDEEDDFVAPSDEEEEVGEESEEDIDEGIDLERTQRSQQGKEGRNAGMDAEGDIEEDNPRARGPISSGATVGAAAAMVDQGDAGSPLGRNAKRRRVIEEDEDE